MNSMHIIFYFPMKLPVYEYGGVERSIQWLIKGLAEFGHTVSYLGLEGSSIPNCHNLPYAFTNIRSPSPQQLKSILPSDTDIIHFNHDQRINFAYELPFINTHSGCLNNITGLRFNDCFLSDAQRKYWGYPENPFIYTGLDTEEYIYKEKKDDYLLFLSRVDWEVKGIDIAIKVAEKTGMRLIIAGNIHKKSFVNSLIRSNFKRKLSDRIHYLGPVGGELKAMLLAKAKALLFPTQWCEPFGIVTIEALASGTPVITTPNGAMPEIIEHGRTGFICKNIDEMIDAVNKIDIISPSNCFRTIKEKFNYRRMAAEYIDLYYGIINKWSRTDIL